VPCNTGPPEDAPPLDRLPEEERLPLPLPPPEEPGWLLPDASEESWKEDPPDAPPELLLLELLAPPLDDEDEVLLPMAHWPSLLSVAPWQWANEEQSVLDLHGDGMQPEDTTIPDATTNPTHVFFMVSSMLFIGLPALPTFT
jgi:hypothetical protein